MSSRPAQLWERTPLRVKLVAIVVLLAGFGLLLSGIAATSALRVYLQGRVDGQLVEFAHRPIPLGDNGPREFDRFFRQGVDPLTGQVRTVIPRGVSGPRLPATLPDHPVTVPSLVDEEAGWRVIGGVDRFGNPAVIGLSLLEVRGTTHQLAYLEILVGLVVLLLMSGAGYAVVQRSLRPLVEVERTAEAIAEGDLSKRVPESDARTEVGSLSRSFNAMLTQVEAAFERRTASEREARASEDRMRRFVGDASHELRTPLTSIRGFAELYRQGALPDAADLDRAMLRIEDEAARMGMLVEDLLVLARLDQQRPLEQEPVDLLELTTDAVQDAHAMEPGREVSLEAVGSGPAPTVRGDERRLRQVFANLLTNALTHTDSAVEVRVATSDAEATVAVIDHGPGIPVADRDRVFERFFRADASRTRASGGSGLGLAIVASLVEAHRGTVRVEQTPGGGATFLVSLPLASG